ncbi:hypothetical protein BGZ94_009908 [Podila epigama]|nr:hypothetical protein BGZ94_009908 [Podila epigama]
MTSRHSRMPSDADRETFSMPPVGLNLARATPIKPQLGMPPMTKDGRENRDQAQAWDAPLNRIFQTMQGEDTVKYLNYFKARLEIEDTYTRALEKLAIPGKGSKSSATNSGLNINNSGSNNSNNNNNNGSNTSVAANNSQADPEDIPTTLQLAFDALLENTQQAHLRRRPFVSLVRNLVGALSGLKEAQEKQRKVQKETARPVFQLYAETRLSTVPKLKKAYEQRCRDVEQVLAIEDSDHLPVRERLKNLANSSGAAGRLAKCRRDMEDADNDYKTAVHSLEAFRQQREKSFDTAYKEMQRMIKERGSKCRQCLEAFVVGERDLNARAATDIDNFSVAVDCIKPTGDMDQLCMYFTKDLYSHPKPVYYENYYTKNVPESVFGTKLSDYVRRYKNPIPLVIVKCADAIDRSGLQKEGIYRVSGRHAQIMNLKKLFELNEETVDLTVPPYADDVSSVAAVLKIYLRELPEPLFPFSLSERSVYSANPDPGARLQELKSRLKRLPDCNIDTLQYLIQHLRRVYDHVEYNKMTLENLSMVFTPAIFHDFNSAMVANGPQPPTQGHARLENSSNLSLSFGNPGAAPSSPTTSSPNATAPWSGYTPPPSDQHQQGMSQQQHQQHQQQQSTDRTTGSGSAPVTVPERSAQGGGGMSPNLQGSSPHLAPGPGVILSSSPSNQSALTTPTQPSFVPPTNTVSTAASWTSDFVMSDLILNSHSIFDVLPKLPSRTQSMLFADEQQSRMLATAVANTNLRADGIYSNSGSGHNVPPPLVRQFNNSRKSSSSSIGGGGSGAVPSSPIEGGHLRRPEPRFDSLGPHSSERMPVAGARTEASGVGYGTGVNAPEMDVNLPYTQPAPPSQHQHQQEHHQQHRHQQQQQQQQQPFQFSTSPTYFHGSGVPPPSALQVQQPHYNPLQHDAGQGRRTNTPPSPSARQRTQRSKSNVDLHQQYQHYQQLEQTYFPQTQYRAPPKQQQQQQQHQQQQQQTQQSGASPPPQWMRQNHGHKEEIGPLSGPLDDVPKE